MCIRDRYEGAAKFHLPQYESPTIEYYIDLLKLTMNFTNLEEACVGFRTLNELNIIHTIIILFYIINNKLVEASQLLPLILSLIHISIAAFFFTSAICFAPSAVK